jgi:hypothetical protein
MAREPARPAGPVPTIARDESSGAAGASSVIMRSPSLAWKPATGMRADRRQTSRHRHPNRRSRAPTAAVAATAATSKEPTAAKAVCPPGDGCRSWRRQQDREIASKYVSATGICEIAQARRKIATLHELNEIEIIC